MSCNRVLGCLGCLEKEVKLDYERATNRMIFDRAITSKPQMFSYVTLPDKEEREVPEKGMGNGGAVGMWHACRISVIGFVLCCRNSQVHSGD